MTEYGKISGYKININESVVMPLNTIAKADPPDTMFQWSPNHITYLGLKIPNEEPNSFSLNYTPLLKKTKEDCKRWNELPLSLIGRINCIKINVLPKYRCYRFLSRSNFLNNSTFTSHSLYEETNHPG